MEMLSVFASIILVGFGLFLSIRKRSLSNIPFSIIMIILGVQEVLDQIILKQSVDVAFYLKVNHILTSLLPSLFMFFSITYSRRGFMSIWSRWWIVVISSILLPIISVLIPAKDLFFAPDLRAEGILYLEGAGYWINFAIICYFVLALINIESTYISLSTIDRKRIRLEAIGLICSVGILIFYFSQGLLYRAIDMKVIPVRAAVLILSSSLIAFSMFKGSANVSIGVSRYVVYRSLTLMLIGTYFIILGLTGEAMRYFGMDFSRVFMIFLAVALAITMLLLVSSEKLKSRAKIFITKHFFRTKHDYRTEWIKFTELLTSCRTTKEVEQVILRTFRNAFDLKGASLYTRSSGENQFHLAANSLMPEIRSFAPSKNLLGYFGKEGRVFRPGDGEYEPTEDENDFTKKSTLFAIVPLIATTGNIDAIVVLGKQMQEEPLLYEDYDLMKTIAKHASLALLTFRLSAELAETREIAAVTRVSAFVIHDLKNLAASLSLLLDNANYHIGNPEFQTDMLVTVRSSVSKMESLIRRLSYVKEKTGLSKSVVDVTRVIDESLRDLRIAYPDITVKNQNNQVLANVDQEEIEKVIINLVLNAIDACNGRGYVNVSTGVDGENVYLLVEDRGEGMTDEFLENQLFKPFRTTKQKGLGIGLFQCKQIVEAHGGRIEVRSVKDKGSSFVVYLPSAHGSGMFVGI